jgi:hypothetical protein
MKDFIRKPISFFLLITIFSCTIKEKSDITPHVIVEIDKGESISMYYYADKMGGNVVVSLPEKVIDVSKFIDAYTSLIQESRKYWDYVEIDHMSLKGSQFTKKENIDILLIALKAKLKKNIILTEYDDKEFTFKIE